MTKAQIKAAQTIANDWHLLGKGRGLFRDELGNIVITNGAIVAIVNDFPTNTTNTAPNGWKSYRKTLERTDSYGDTTITLDMLKDKPEFVAVNHMAFLVKALKRIVKLCGGQCTISAIGDTPQKFYGKNGVIGLVMPCRIGDAEVGTL